MLLMARPFELASEVGLVHVDGKFEAAIRAVRDFECTVRCRIGLTSSQTVVDACATPWRSNANARVAYETTVHRRVDPALAEWSSGNRATLRVYPIPAKGEKKVWLSYNQEIVRGDFVPDLRWGRRLRSADVRIDADGRFVHDGLDVSYERPYRLQLSNAALDRVLTAEADPRTEVLAARDETADRWYLAAAPRVAAPAGAVAPARELVVFWIPPAARRIRIARQSSPSSISSRPDR